MSSARADEIEIVFDGYLGEDSNAYCQAFADEIGNAIRDGRLSGFEFCTHNGNEVEGYSYDGGLIGLNDWLHQSDLARVAFHEGYHHWLNNGSRSSSEEGDAQWWGNYCIGGGEN